MRQVGIGPQPSAACGSGFRCLAGAVRGSPSTPRRRSQIPRRQNAAAAADPATYVEAGRRLFRKAYAPVTVSRCEDGSFLFRFDEAITAPDRSYSSDSSGSWDKGDANGGASASAGSQRDGNGARTSADELHATGWSRAALLGTITISKQRFAARKVRRMKEGMLPPPTALTYSLWDTAAATAQPSSSGSDDGTGKTDTAAANTAADNATTSAPTNAASSADATRRQSRRALRRRASAAQRSRGSGQGPSDSGPAQKPSAVVGAAGGGGTRRDASAEAREAQGAVTQLSEACDEWQGRVVGSADASSSSNGSGGGGGGGGSGRSAKSDSPGKKRKGATKAAAAASMASGAAAAAAVDSRNGASAAGLATQVGGAVDSKPSNSKEPAVPDSASGYDCSDSGSGAGDDDGVAAASAAEGADPDLRLVKPKPAPQAAKQQQRLRQQPLAAAVALEVEPALEESGAEEERREGGGGQWRWLAALLRPLRAVLPALLLLWRLLPYGLRKLLRRGVAPPPPEVHASPGLEAILSTDGRRNALTRAAVPHNFDKEGRSAAPLSDLPRWRVEALVDRGVRPASMHLYRTALTATSSLPQSEQLRVSCSYERLEFLGDAVVSLVVREALMEHFPQQNEGFMTKLHNQLVSAICLYEVGRSLTLERYLAANAHDMRYMGHATVNVLTDVVLVGALFLDRGYEAAARWVRATVLADLDSLELQDNHKSALLSYCRSRGLPWPSFRAAPMSRARDADSGEETMMWNIEVTMAGRGAVGAGSDFYKKTAEQKASLDALQALKRSERKRR